MTTHVATPSAAELLGLRVPERDPLALVRALEHGLPSRALLRFKKIAGLADAEVATLLRLSGRTLTRMKTGAPERLPADLSERLYSLAAIYAEAEQVFGDRDTAWGWLDEPNVALARTAPRSLLNSELGRQQVRALLKRIEFGLLA